MLEVGKVFNKNGLTLCVLDFVDYKMKKYVLMSVEDEKIEYSFFEVIMNGNDYRLSIVTDEELSNNLFSILEKEGL